MPIPNSAPQVMGFSEPMQATAPTPVDQDRLSVADQYDIAASERNPARLWQMAEALKGTPAGQVAADSAKVIIENSNRWDDLNHPIDNAKTPQEKNIAVAEVISKTHEPQWRNAIIAKLLGHGEDAYKLITGGTPQTTYSYADNGHQIKTVSNELGNVLSRFDTETGQQISDADFSKMGGGQSTLDTTLKKRALVGLNKDFTEEFAKNIKTASVWNEAAKSYEEPVNRALDQIVGLKKGNEIPPDIFSQTLKNVTLTAGNTTTRSDNVTTLKQMSGGGGDKVNNEKSASILAGMGFPGAYLDGKGGFTDSKGNHHDWSELENKQTSGSTGSETSNQATTGKDAILAAYRAGKLTEPQQRQLTDIYGTLSSIANANAKLEAEIGRPRFLMNPANITSEDGYTNMVVYLNQLKFNKEALEGYQKYSNKNMKARAEDGHPPMPGEQEKAYTDTEYYKSLKKDYAEKARAILKETNSTLPKEKTTGAAIPPAAKPAGVGSKPSKKRMSADEIAAMAGD